MPSIRELFDQIDSKPDPWRASVGFSTDIEAVHKELFSGSVPSTPLSMILNDWLRKSGNQPCVFGRLAATQNLLSHCILQEQHLVEEDDAIRDRIQSARLGWIREGYEGKKVGSLFG